VLTLTPTLLYSPGPYCENHPPIRLQADYLEHSPAMASSMTHSTLFLQDMEPGQYHILIPTSMGARRIQLFSSPSWKCLFYQYNKLVDNAVTRAPFNL
jgi:hypothetical protein